MASGKYILKLILRVAVLVLVIKAINTSDPYVKELRKECYKTKRPYYCVKFKLLKFLQDFDYEGPNNSAVKLVKIKPKFDASYLLPTPRHLATDTEWEKLVKFLKRKLVEFLSTHGIAFPAFDGFEVIEGRNLKENGDNLEEKSDDLLEGRGKGMGGGNKIKEKKIFILSVIIMAKLFKIMVILNMVFFTLLVIKKIILMAAVMFPSVLSHIKQACQRHHQAEEAIKHIPPETSWFGWRQDDKEKPYW